jgi:hypothetical protein
MSYHHQGLQKPMELPHLEDLLLLLEHRHVKHATLGKLYGHRWQIAVTCLDASFTLPVPAVWASNMEGDDV